MRALVAAGRLWPATRQATDRLITDLRKNGAPAATGTPPNPTAEKEPKDMSILHHEDASVYGKGVVHHPLSGRPEFKGLVDTPGGPLARIQDGDLVLTIDDLATLIRWRDVFQVAAGQLALHAERLAAHAARQPVSLHKGARS